jgi:hypothetical protein
VCAFANTNGGTLYIGVSSESKKTPVEISKPTAAIRRLEQELSKRISPPIACQVDRQETQGKMVIRVLVPRGEDPPYAVDDNKIYVRDEADTGLAVRDEIVQLVLRGSTSIIGQEEIKPKTEEGEEVAEVGVQPPRTGVEIVGFEKRNGVSYYTMRDLRNGNVVKNVTQSSARRLWHYAISQYTSLPRDLKGVKVTWQRDLGLLRVQKRGQRKRFDLVQKSPDGIRYYFGVTEDGIHGEWKRLVGGEVE